MVDLFCDMIRATGFIQFIHVTDARLVVFADADGNRPYSIQRELPNFSVTELVFQVPNICVGLRKPDDGKYEVGIDSFIGKPPHHVVKFLTRAR